jgi:hypothetical protein
MDIQELDGGMEWTDLAKNTEVWQVLMNAVTDLWVPKKCGEFLK